MASMQIPMSAFAGFNNSGMPEPGASYAIGAFPESNKAKRLSRVSAILSIIIGVLFIVGIATNYWTSGPGFFAGLFRACVSSGSNVSSEGNVCGPSFNSSGGVIIPGMIFYDIGLILNLVVVLTKSTRKRGMMHGAVVMYCFTVVFVVIAVGMYGGKYDLSWSFGLTCFVAFGALVLAIVAGVSCYEYEMSVRVVITTANIRGDSTRLEFDRSTAFPF